MPDEKPADKMEFHPINAVEEVVMQNVRTHMDQMDMCRCDKCYSDVCALVLNQVKPQYVTTRRGALLSRTPQLSHDYRVDLTVKIVTALRMVQENPHH